MAQAHSHLLRAEHTRHGEGAGELGREGDDLCELEGGVGVGGEEGVGRGGAAGGVQSLFSLGRIQVRK